jgi:hypothetical protein
MRRFILLLALLPLAGCASMGQPLHVACLACSTLAASGACASRAPLTTTCPEGEELWITNYRDFLERGARPVIECKPRRFGSDLP